MKIGNYIHYKYSNYREYGLGLNEGSKPDPNKAFRLQREAIITRILPSRSIGSKTAIKTQLESQMNFFFNPSATGTIMSGYTAAEQEKLQQQIIEIFNQAIAKANINLKNARIDWNNLSATGGGSVNLGSSSAPDIEEFALTRKTTIGGGKKTTTMSAVIRRIEALTKLRNNLADSSVNKTETDKDFIEAVDKLNTKYKDVIQSIKDSMSAQGLSIVKARGIEALQGKMAITDSNSNFIEEIQRLIDMTKQVTDTQVTGLLGEYIPAITQYVLNDVAARGIKKCLEPVYAATQAISATKGVVGGDRTRKALLKSNVIDSRTNTHTSDAQIGDVDIRTNYTQDKVDVIFSLPESQTINASMKNVNMFSGRNIHLLKGVSSLNFLQDYGEFANHYLNITANIGRDPAYGSPPEEQIQKAHETMKLTIALHALAGGVWGESADGSIGKSPLAEIFVVNNSGAEKGNFTVYFMSDIIDKVSENINLIDIKNFNATKQWNNTWVKATSHDMRITAAFKRVAAILAQLHTQKLEVSLKWSALGT